MFMVGMVTYTYVRAHSEAASIHELPRRGLLGNPYAVRCIASPDLGSVWLYEVLLVLTGDHKI
jgi:hypothetical protein